MKIRHLPLLLAASAAALIAVAAPASATTTPHAQAASLTCASTGDGWWYNFAGEVNHWYDKGHEFTAPTSGHQDVCDYTVRVNGTPVGEQFVIEDGPATGNCVKLLSNTVNGVIGAGGCVKGQKNELVQFHTFPDGTQGWYFASYTKGCWEPDAVNSTWNVQPCQDVAAEQIVYQYSPS